MPSPKALSGSASAPEFCPASAAPGGPWVLRTSTLQGAGRAVAKPPKHEAQAIAWKAARKATLQGQIGTGNRISSVVQYPISTRDPSNMAQNVKNHLSAEERRILRVWVKHHMKGKPSYPDSVYAVEKVILKGFAASPELCQAFYSNDTLAEQLLGQAAHAVEGGYNSLDAPSSGSHSRSASTSGDGPRFTRPGQHGPTCGPQCYCLRFQDAPLHAKTNIQGSWEESFTNKTKFAAASVVDHITHAARQSASMRAKA